MKKSCLLFIASLLLLGSCDVKNAPDSSGSSIEYDSTQLEDLDDVNYAISLSSSGCLFDIGLGFSLSTSSTYTLEFTITDGSNDGVNVYTDNPNVLTVAKDGSGKWATTTHKAGYSHIIIEDSLGMIHFRRKVKVVPKLTKEQAIENTYTPRYWKTAKGFGYYGSLSMTLFDEMYGYVSGSESDSSTSWDNSSFEYKMVTEEERPYNDIAEDYEHWYIFEVTEWKDDTVSVQIDYFAMKDSGDLMHVHDQTGSLLGVLSPYSSTTEEE